MREVFIDSDDSSWVLDLMRSGAGLIPCSATRDGERIVGTPREKGALTSAPQAVGQSHVEPGEQPGTLWLIDGDERQLARLAKVGDDWWVHLAGHVSRIRVVESGTPSRVSAGEGLVAPMPGKVLALMCEQGDEVEAGQALMVLEAMKMENRICAAAAGTVVTIHHGVGAQVDQGALLIELDSDDEP